MMCSSLDLPAVYLCREAIDFRKEINGLAVLVEEVLALDPFSEQFFVSNPPVCGGARFSAPGTDLFRGRVSVG